MAEKRKEHMNELRKAHFHLGFDKSAKQTDYRENYTEKDLKSKEPLNAEAQRFEEYRKNPRQTHYTLAEQIDPSLYESIAKQSYKESVSEKAQLSENTKNDLRSHHFTLGYHGVDHPSEYKREFLKREPQNISQADKAEMQAFLRKHNHDFGDRKNYYNTTYDVQHNQTYDKEYLKQAMTKDDLRRKTLEIRKTNIKIGNAQNDYTTQNSVVHDQKHGQRTNIDTFLQGSKMVLGVDNPQMMSVNKSTYQGQQPAERYTINKDQIRDFRATHFELALQKENQKESTAQADYKNYQAEMRNPIIPQQNFHMEQGLSKEDVLDAYTSAYKGGIGKGVHIGVPQKGFAVRASQVVLGSDPVNEDHYRTEARKNFVQHNEVEKVKLSEERIQNLKQHHFDLGEEQPTEYLTNNMEYKGVGPRTSLDEKTLKGLRAHHFQYGSANGSYYVHSSEIGSKQGPPNHLNKEKQEELRRHHFQEDGETNYRTSYQVQTQKA